MAKVIKLTENDVEKLVKKIIKEDTNTSDKVKLFVSRVQHNPYREDMVTEVPEKVFQIDGYSVADRMLEGVLFDVYFNGNGDILKVEISDNRVKTWFEDNFNATKWYNVIKTYAEGVLEGDEVDVPNFIKDKYFRNGIDGAYIVNEKNA